MENRWTKETMILIGEDLSNWMLQKFLHLVLLHYRDLSTRISYLWTKEFKNHLGWRNSKLRLSAINFHLFSLSTLYRSSYHDG